MTRTDDDTRAGQDAPISKTLHLVPDTVDGNQPGPDSKVAIGGGPARKRGLPGPKGKSTTQQTNSGEASSAAAESRSNVIDFAQRSQDRKLERKWQRTQKLADECVANGDDFYTFCEKADLLPPVWDNWDAPSLDDAFCYGFYLKALVKRMNAFADDVEEIERLAALADRAAEDSIELLLPSVSYYFSDAKVRKRFDAFISGQRVDGTACKIMALDFALRLRADACLLTEKAGKQMRKLKRRKRGGGTTKPTAS
jgi:hypothetical protein